MIDDEAVWTPVKGQSVLRFGFGVKSFNCELREERALERWCSE